MIHHQLGIKRLSGCRLPYFCILIESTLQLYQDLAYMINESNTAVNIRGAR